MDKTFCWKYFHNWLHFYLMRITSFFLERWINSNWGGQKIGPEVFVKYNFNDVFFKKISAFLLFEKCINDSRPQSSNNYQAKQVHHKNLLTPVFICICCFSLIWRRRKKILVPIELSSIQVWVLCFGGETSTIDWRVWKLVPRWG